MLRLCVVSLVVGITAVAAAASPGGYFSFSESALKRGTAALVPTLVKDIKNIVIPGMNMSLPFGAGFWFDPIRFQDVTIASHDVSVLSGQGVQVSLKNMSNDIAHTKLGVHLGFVHCTGEIWALAHGASYTAMNTIVVDKDGIGKLNTVTPPGGFVVGDIQVHHKMDQVGCEVVADVLHLVDSAIIDLITNTLKAKFAGIVAAAVDTPVNFLLHELESPPALGFGKEKFKLDNTYLSVSYDNHRITHLHKAEFKSTLHPQESSLVPPTLNAPGTRDAEYAFSDYVLNTLFEAMFAEHVGETQIKIPFVKTIFDKECPKCPIVIKTTFGEPGRQTFLQGKAMATFTGMNMEIGALSNASKVLPMVTLNVNASADVAFALEQTPKNYGVKASLALDDFAQRLVVSHIGKIDTSDITRDLKLLVAAVFTTLNKDIPALPIPPIAGVKLGNPAFNVTNHALLLLADLVATPATIVLI